MTDLKPGALDSLSEEQRRRKVEAHEKLRRAFEKARISQPKTEVPKGASVASDKVVHRMPTPMGTQTTLRNTPAADKRQRTAELLAQQQKKAAAEGQEKARARVEARKEFSKATQVRKVEMIKPRGRQR